MNQPRKIIGTVLKLRCAKCNQSFPHFRLIGDVDTDTADIGTMTSCVTNEVVVSEMLPDEWNSWETGGALHFEKRISQELGRNDLRTLRLIRTEQTRSVPNGIGFKEFRENFVKPQLVYSCIHCKEGEAKTVEEMSVEHFRRVGGEISSRAPLDL